MRWGQLETLEKQEIRSFLMADIVDFPILPPMVSNKLIKVIADIGKREVSRDWPEYFQFIFDLACNPATLKCSLLLLKTTVEEFISSREDIDALSRKECQKKLSENTSKILMLSGGLLAKIYDTIIPGFPNVSAPTSSPNVSIGYNFSELQDNHGASQIPALAAFIASMNGDLEILNEERFSKPFFHGGQIGSESKIIAEISLGSCYFDTPNFLFRHPSNIKN